jgi:hypothetical protein
MRRAVPINRAVAAGLTLWREFRIPRHGQTFNLRRGAPKAQFLKLQKL